MRQKLLLLAALFFGFLAFVFTYQQIKQEKERIRGVAKDIDVIQITRDMTEGQKITEDDIRRLKWKTFANAGGARDNDVLWSQKDIIVGREIQIPLRAGDRLRWDDLKTAVAAGKNGLTAFVRPGFRAIAIAVDSTASVNCLVQPNNYVDLIGTFRFPDTRGDASLDTITLTILQRVRIIATGTDLGLQMPGRSMQRSYSAVVLELTPKEVEMIIFASQKGRIQLSLRNYEDMLVTPNLQSVDWSYLQKNVQKYMQEREALLNPRK